MKITHTNLKHKKGKVQFTIDTKAKDPRREVQRLIYGNKAHLRKAIHAAMFELAMEKKTPPDVRAKLLNTLNNDAAPRRHGKQKQEKIARIGKKEQKRLEAEKAEAAMGGDDRPSKPSKPERDSPFSKLQ